MNSAVRKSYLNGFSRTDSSDHEKDDVSHFMSFWKIDLISLDSSSSFKGKSVFSPLLNFLMLCWDKILRTLRQSEQFSANDKCLAQWLSCYRAPQRISFILTTGGFFFKFGVNSRSFYWDQSSDHGFSVSHYF